MNKVLIQKLQEENKRLKQRVAELEKEIQKTKTHKAIIARVNAMLDKSLYELGVMNKLHKLLTSVLDYQKIIKSILELLEEMVDHDVSAVLIKQEEEFPTDIKINLVTPKTQSYIEAFKRKIIKPFVDSGFLDKEKIEVEIFNKQKLIIEEKKNNRLDYSFEKIGSIEQALLKVADRLIGTLYLLKEDKVGFSEDDRWLLALVANTASIAIENALLHKKLERLAITDGLTSLYNHRQFMESLYKEIKRAQRYNLIFSVILLDIDDFKLINDTYGHLKGDEVLKNLAKIIKENLHRGIDIAGRYGGEEFSIILSQTNKEGAVIISERIRLAVKDKLAKLSGIKKEITVSLGVATYPYDAKSDRDIIHVADLALYRAKREGKNRTVVASS